MQCCEKTNDSKKCYLYVGGVVVGADFQPPILTEVQCLKSDRGIEVANHLNERKGEMEIACEYEVNN